MNIQGNMYAGKLKGVEKVPILLINKYFLKSELPREKRKTKK